MFPVGLIAILLVNLGLFALGRLGFGGIGQTIAAVIACPIVMLILIFAGIAPTELTQEKWPDMLDWVSPFVAAIFAGFAGGAIQVLSFLTFDAV